MEVQAYKQWCQALLTNRSNKDLTVKEAEHDAGKFYEYPDKDKEIQPGSLNGTVVKAGATFSVAGCGRSDAAVGSDAEFSLFDGNKKVGHIHFVCPWGIGDNTFYPKSEYPNEWFFNMIPAEVNQDGAIGTVTVIIAYLGA
ncbi:hypothetical protein PRZ48_001768 [Zasmidium cellare]|uniref:Uncharacterized protein n=1 Tax=Zasmidium cellare TaxID=395010 RepID=A0ABR0F261_ZASCE|nr:hypothetical protein PRZ48_001768 [Zasmidium cellare]